MPNPYGITEVNVPQLFQVAQQAQESRIRNMLLQRQMEQQEREAERQTGIQQVLARHFAGSSQANPVSSSQGTQSPQTAQPTQVAPAAPAAPTAGRPPVDRRQLFADLAVYDVQEASRIAQAFSQMDEAEVRQAARRSEALARAAMRWQRIPDEAQRAQAAQADFAELMQLGVTQEQLQALEFDNDALGDLVNGARDIERIIESSQPQLRNVGPGDVVIDVRNPGGPPVYESPYVEQGGMIYERPDALRTLPQPRSPEEARRLPPGTRFRLPDGSIGTVPGGPQASPSAGNFPAGPGR